MKPSFSRRYRRRTKPAKTEGSFFKKESQHEQSFFGEAAHGSFFQPAATNAPGQSIQRKCADCEKEDKQAQRKEEKKEEEEKMQRAADKKEEDKKVMRAPEKKEEDEKKLQRQPEKKEEDDKKLMRAPEKKEEEEKKIQRKEDKKEEEDKKIQKKEAGDSSSSGGNVSNYVSSLNGKGQAMSATDNHFFSSRIGYDFSNVRIHTDKEAAESAKAVNAKAYTIGNNIVFNEGQYNTGSEEGKKLMAHELTHVVQQEESQLQRSVNYVAPVPQKEDPIPKVLGNASSKLGSTYIMINGAKQETRDDVAAALGTAIYGNLTLDYDAAAKQFKVNTTNININISAEMKVMTDPVDNRWSAVVAGAAITRNPACAAMPAVPVHLYSMPSGAVALAAEVERQEYQHLQDIVDMARTYIDPFFTYLEGIRLHSETGTDGLQLLQAEIGNKDMEMVFNFANGLLAANAVHDNPGGTHHYKSVTTGDCNTTNITVQF